MHLPVLALMLLPACSEHKGDKGQGGGSDTGDGTTPDEEPAGDLDGDGIDTEDGDCDDQDDAIHPGAEELCNGIDDDCDGKTDEDPSDGLLRYTDMDGDGFGDEASGVRVCAEQAGLVETTGDCDDTDPFINPTGHELCNHRDDDCDGEVDLDGWIPDELDSFAAALDAASDGHCFCVAGGTYRESGLLALVDIGFEAEAGAEVVLDGGGERIFTNAAPLLLKGITLQNASTLGAAGGSFIQASGGDITLEDVLLQDLRWQGDVYTGLAIDATLSTVTLRNVQISGIEVADADEILAALISVWDGALVVDGLALFDISLDAAETVEAALIHVRGPVSIRNLDIESVDVVARSSRGLVWLVAEEQLDLEQVSISDAHLSAPDGAELLLTGGLLGTLNTGLVPTGRVHNLSIAGNTVEGIRTATGLVARVPAGNLVLDAVVIAGNTLYPVEGADSRLYGLFDPGTGTFALRNADITANDLGLWARVEGGIIGTTSPGSVFLRNLSVVGNSLSAEVVGQGLVYHDGSSESVLDADHLNVHGNTDLEALLTERDGPLPDPPHLFDEDPLYIDTSPIEPQRWDLRLQPESPLIDQGDPAILDPDGSTSDIGAHGGPWGQSW